MGYCITIGNRKGKEIEVITHDSAPAYGEPTDHRNERWPSYYGWSEFATATLLYSLMFNKKDGLIRQHPGIVPLTKRHQKVIDKAIEKFKASNPDVKPSASTSERAMHLARLTWLKYWVDWSLANCKRPAISNT